MNRRTQAELLRLCVVAGVWLAVLVPLVVTADTLGLQGGGRTALALVLTALAAAALSRWRSSVDGLVERVTRQREVTPYAALAETARRLQTGSLDEALPGLARVLADGTGAARASVWLAVGDGLVIAAGHPPSLGDAGDQARVADLAELLARPETAHVVPVRDGAVLAAVLVIEKPDGAVNASDRALMRDMAGGAGLLLRGVALNAELADRVHRAGELAAQLQASRTRLALARDVERRRLLTELSRTTTEPLAALRRRLSSVRSRLMASPADGTAAAAELASARSGLDDLILRFRVIARGVYPAVLRGQGLRAAVEELIADLPRAVRLTGDVDVRLPWEIESSLYYVVAAALGVLAGQASDAELSLRLGRSEGRLRTELEDPEPPLPAAELLALLADDAERLSVLGGALEWDPTATEQSALRLVVWLPDHLEPLLHDRADPAAPALL